MHQQRACKYLFKAQTCCILHQAVGFSWSCQWVCRGLGRACWIASMRALHRDLVGELGSNVLQMKTVGSQGGLIALTAAFNLPDRCFSTLGFLQDGKLLASFVFPDFLTTSGPVHPAGHFNGSRNPPFYPSLICSFPSLRIIWAQTTAVVRNESV